MLYKADFSRIPTPKMSVLFLYLIQLEFPVDLVMCLFYHTCLSTSPKWGNKCSQEKHPLPCLKPLDICSVLVSPQATLPYITLLLFFFFFSFKTYLGNKTFQQTLCPHLFNFGRFCSLFLLSYVFDGSPYS